MSEKKPDNLENFFRKGLGSHDFEFREDDWAELEARLDEAVRTRALFWRNVWAATTAVLLALVLFLLNFGGDLTVTKDALPLEPAGGDRISQKAEQEPSPEMDDRLNEQSLPEANHQSAEKQPPEVVDPAPEGPNSPGSTPTSGRVGPRAQTTAERPAGAIGSPDPDGPLTRKPAGNTVPIYPGPVEEVQPAEGLRIQDLLIGATTSSLTPKSAGEIHEQAALPELLAVQEATGLGSEEEKREHDQLNSRFAVGVMLGPDLSSIGMSDYTDPGFNLGLNLEYYVLNKLSINAGLITGTKKYMAKGREYGKGRGLWTRGMVPDTTWGKCVVLDLPINVRYYPLSGERHNLFLSAGVSSYLFLSEDYDFIYVMNAPDLIQGWSGKNEVSNYFGVVNLSLGYELRLQKQLYLQVEPFFKLPIEKLGFGNVDLLTTGMYFTLKYRFPRRSRRENHINGSIDE